MQLVGEMAGYEAIDHLALDPAERAAERAAGGRLRTVTPAQEEAPTFPRHHNAASPGSWGTYSWDMALWTIQKRP
jgi:hypothetical protein